MRLFRVRQ